MPAPILDESSGPILDEDSDPILDESVDTLDQSVVLDPSIVGTSSELGQIDAVIELLPTGSSTWSQAVADEESPYVPAGAAWGPLVTLANPVRLELGDALSVNVTGDGGGTAGTSLDIVIQLVVGGFTPDDTTTSHEWADV